MKHTLLKALAVVCSLAIGGAYVAWRSAGARKAEQTKLVEQARAKALEEIDSNWRSAVEEPGSSVVEDEEVMDQDLLPSSKIGILEFPSEEPGEPDQKDPRLLPSSKSIDWILDNPKREKPE